MTVAVSMLLYSWIPSSLQIIVYINQINQPLDGNVEATRYIILRGDTSKKIGVILFGVMGDPFNKYKSPHNYEVKAFQSCVFTPIL